VSKKNRITKNKLKLYDMKNQFKNNGAGYLFAITLLLLTSSFISLGNRPSNEKIIKDYYAAYEKKDWNMLASLLADGFTFTSPNDDHIDLTTYKERCWPNSANIKRFDIDKIVVNGDDAFVTYNGWTIDGRVFRNTEYFKFKDGKIKENACFFGPGISFPNNKGK
jgi:ketosteroid isomerase-like protein